MEQTETVMFYKGVVLSDGGVTASVRNGKLTEVTKCFDLI